MNKPEVRSGRINTAAEQNSAKKITREELMKQIRKMRDRDAELVTGVFKNLENPATGGSTGTVVFNYKAYHGDEFVSYELRDGERYSLPRGVARHLNNNCFYKEYQHLNGEHGVAGIRGAAADGRYTTSNMQMARKVHRYAFHSLEYMDDDTDMYPSNLVEVTITP